MWPNPQEIATLVAFTEEIRNGNIHFLCSGYCYTKMVILLLYDGYIRLLYYCYTEDLMNCHYTTKP